jgi:PEP-CTERM motif-containing protein
LSKRKIMRSSKPIVRELLVAGAALNLVGASLGQGFIFSNVGVNGGARAAVYGPEPGNPFLQLWGNTPEGRPPGTQSYSGPLLAGAVYSTEAWYTLAPVGNPSQLAITARPVGGSLTTFSSSATPGIFGSGNVIIPDANSSPTSNFPFYVYLQVRAWDNAGGQLPSWDEAWNAAVSGSGRPVGWSQVFFQPLDASNFPWPGLINFESFNLFNVPEPATLSLVLLGAATFCLFRRKAHS